MKKWQLQNDNLIDNAAVRELCEELDILEPTARLLINRGYTTPQTAGRFIRSEDSVFYDPFIMADMDKAVDRILTALDRKERVMIFGDYDVDGVTSVSVLYLYLKSLGIECAYHIPSRIAEGYGISTSAIDQIISDGYTLMISVDTGITASEEISYANSKRLDTIVTDHHECHGELPPAVAVVNPKRPDCPYPFKELAGVGVVFKLVSAVHIKMNEASGKEENPFRYICNEYSDLVATGTIADVMPLVDENRLIVSVGLKKMEMDTRVGISALLNEAGIHGGDKPRRITSSTVGYTLAPRINAAGRLSEASIAVELMLCNDASKAKELAQTLCGINEQRREEENEIAKEAAEMISGDYDFNQYPVIVLAKENWHHGVIGIVSSRLTDRFGLPSILVSFDEDGMGKGSGRSVKGLNLVDALSFCSDTLEKFGGHELAAGLTVKKECFDEFKEKINQYARENFDHDSDCIICPVDLVLEPKDINLRQAKELFLLEPYGTDNPMPAFVMCSAVVIDIKGIGANKHSRLTISKDGVSFGAVYFGMSPESAEFTKGDKVDVIFTLEINEFRGVTNVQMNIKQILPDCESVKEAQVQGRLYHDICKGAHYSSEDEIFPTRRELAALYTYVKRSTKKKTYTAKELIEASMLSGKNGRCKLQFMLDIFEEMNLLSVEREDNDFELRYHLGVKFVRGKVNLDKSIVMKNLRSKQDKT